MVRGRKNAAPQTHEELDQLAATGPASGTRARTAVSLEERVRELEESQDKIVGIMHVLAQAQNSTDERVKISVEEKSTLCNGPCIGFTVVFMLSGFAATLAYVIGKNAEMMTSFSWMLS
jgi:hypothetical protein